ICEGDQLFSRLRDSLVTFMSQWVSSGYLKRCAGRPNSNNPCLFNDMSNTIFLQEFVRVYRKAEVRIEAKLYDLYQSLGLFDATHTIGIHPFLWSWYGAELGSRNALSWRMDPNG
ncbi:hypothetical protein K438DRAFT_2085333, partial [Mycena galopus ATCC 62051]